MRTIVIIIVIVLIFILLIMKAIVLYAFHRITLSKRDSKEDFLKFLTASNRYDVSNYNNLNLEEIYLTSFDGLQLKGYFFNPFPEQNRVLLFAHGYTANHCQGLEFIEFFRSLGFNTLFVDLRSHGDSEGKYATYGVKEREDLTRWISYLKKRIGEDACIGLMGQSMGASSVLSCLDKDGKVNFVISDCGFSSASELIKHRIHSEVKLPIFPFYILIRNYLIKKCDFNLDDASPISIINNAPDTPILFIHGNKDSVVPYKMSVDLYKKRNNSIDMLCLFEGAEHVSCYSTDKNKYEQSVINFLYNHHLL